MRISDEDFNAVVCTMFAVSICDRRMNVRVGRGQE